MKGINRNPNTHTKTTIGIYLILILLLLSGCRKEKTVYNAFRPLAKENWCVGDAADFDVEIPKDGSYCIYVAIRHTADYNMANLRCFIQASDSIGVSLRDTLNVMLADTTGKWLGSGRLIRTVEQPLVNRCYFKQGTHRIRLRQGMGISCLEQIRDIGIRVTKEL